MDRQYRIAVVVTVFDADDPAQEQEYRIAAIEEARDQLMRWQVTDDHGVRPEVEELS